jgi:hypothetical protein
MTKEKAWQKFCEGKMPQRRDYMFPREGAFWECFDVAWSAGYIECLREEVAREEKSND